MPPPDDTDAHAIPKELTDLRGRISALEELAIYCAETHTDQLTPATNPLMSRDEVAALLGIKPNSVRDTLRRRAGIEHIEGYPRRAVERFAKTYTKRAGQGRRTDLEKAAAKPIAETITTMRDQLAAIHQQPKDTS